MKRKKTQLEESLIEKGWYLIQKTYTGKHSDKVLEYTYEKVYYEHIKKCANQVFLTSFIARVVLDNKREKIENILIETPNKEFVDDFTLLLYAHKINGIRKEVEDKQDEPTKID